MKLTKGGGGGGRGYGAGTHGGGHTPYKGGRVPSPFSIIGFVMLPLTMMLFVFCGKTGGEEGNGSVHDDAPAEENPQRVSAVRLAPSFLDRANAFIDGTGGLLANVAAEGTKVTFFGAGGVCVVLGLKIGYAWVCTRIQYVKLNALEGEALARIEEAAALAASTISTGNQAVLNKSKHPTPQLTHNQELERRNEPAPPPPPPPLVCPGYEELREQGMFKPDRLLLGASHNGPVYRVGKQHGSGYITALSGYGKSNEMAFLGCQILDQEQPGIVDLLDPHSIKPESLYNYLGPLANENVLGRPMGLDYASCKTRLREIKAELYEILDHGRAPEPRIILVEEGNGFATHADTELRKLFLDVAQLCAQQMRAFNVFMVVAIQHPTVQDLGGKSHGGAIRDCFGWSLCGRVPYKMAPIALRIAAANAPKDTESLQPGDFYIVDEANRPLYIKTPLVTKADMVEVARRRLTRERQTGEANYGAPYAPLSPVESRLALDTDPTLEIAVQPPRRALVEDVDTDSDIERLIGQGLTNPQVIAKLEGEDCRGGRRYEAALARIRPIRMRIEAQYAGVASSLEADANGTDDLLD